jgi:hypothetical protein
MASDRDTRPATPLWVKLFGLAALVLLVLVVAVLVFGGGPGQHGPRRHVPSTANLEAEPPAAVLAAPDLAAGRPS